MKFNMFLIIPLCLFLVACASSPSATTYSRDQVRTVQQVELGTIASVQQVQIEGTKSGAGAAIGAVVGGIAGSGVSNGRGSSIATVLGAVGGGLLGHTIENAATKKTGLELTVELDSGRLVSVVQEAEEPFRVGDRVRLLSRGGVTRVSH